MYAASEIPPAWLVPCMLLIAVDHIRGQPNKKADSQQEDAERLPRELRKSRYAIPVSSRMSPIGYPTDSEYANTLSLAEWSVG